MSYNNDQLKALHERYKAAKMATTNWRNSWTDIARYCMPQDVDRFTYGLGSPQPSASQGRQIGRDIIDDTALRSVPKGAAALNSLLTPDVSKWHYIGPMDDELAKDREAALWYERVNNLLFTYRYAPAAQFKTARMGSYTSVIAYGNGIMYIDDGDKRSALSYRASFVGDVVFDQNDLGVVDTAFRLIIMRAHQIASKFGRDNLPEKVQKCIEKGGPAVDEQFEVLHIVTPNQNYRGGRLGPEGENFSDLYVFCDGYQVLKEGGHRTFPYAIDRYLVGTGETYARGPAGLCFPSIMTLQRMKTQRFKHDDRTADPVLFLPEEVSPVSLVPGARNYGYVTPDGRSMVSQLQMGSLATTAEDYLEEKRAVEDAMLVSFFRLLNERKEMTATEVIEAMREKGALYAPMMALMQDTGASAQIDRELEILFKRGMIPPPPPVVVEAGMQYKVTYDNLATRMLKSETGTAFGRVIAQVAELQNLTQDPSVLDPYDLDVASREFGVTQGVPASWMRSEADVKARRDSRAQQQQQEQMLQAAPAIASTLKVANERQ